MGKLYIVKGNGIEWINVTLLRILDCGTQIKSVSRLLKKFPRLKTVIIRRTGLADGNLKPVLKHPTLSEFYIDHKKHYNLKDKEINKLLAEKRT